MSVKENGEEEEEEKKEMEQSDPRTPLSLHLFSYPKT